MSWVQVTHVVILSNVILFVNLLFNSYFKKSTVGLHILYVILEICDEIMKVFVSLYIN